MKSAFPGALCHSLDAAVIAVAISVKDGCFDARVFRACCEYYAQLVRHSDRRVALK